MTGGLWVFFIQEDLAATASTRPEFLFVSFVPLWFKESGPAEFRLDLRVAQVEAALVDGEAQRDRGGRPLGHRVLGLAARGIHRQHDLPQRAAAADADAVRRLQEHV